MMNRWLLLLLLLLTACAPAAVEVEEEALLVADGRLITVFRSPSCSCCGEWIAYMEANGFTVREEAVQNTAEIKQQYNIPTELWSCHTSVVAGYVLEGHVPAPEIERLLAEGDAVLGLAVAGMPAGSPGMLIQGVEPVPYDVVTFDAAGNTAVYASYNQ